MRFSAGLQSPGECEEAGNGLARRWPGVRCELGKCFAAVRKTASVRTRTLTNAHHLAHSIAERRRCGFTGSGERKPTTNPW